MRRWLKRVVLGLLFLAALTVVVVAFLISTTKLPGEETTPAGVRRNTAFYIKMRDRVPIAADVWLPRDYQSGQRLPVLLRTTRYGRDGQFGWAFRLMVALKQTAPHGPGDSQTDYLNERHFAVVVADARGSGASGGHRDMEFSREEISDLGELARWSAEQSWSNGRVGTFGGSYEGTTAELTAATNTPAVKAVAAVSSPLDAGMQIFPGGIYNQNMVRAWSDLIRGLDGSGDVCVADKLTGPRCWWAGRVLRGVKRVDDDHDGKELAAILAQRRNRYPDGLLSQAEFRDAAIPLPDGSSFTFPDISPVGHRNQIEQSHVEMQIWCGWMDGAVCGGALSRYSTFKNPQQLIMGAFSHNLEFTIDPFQAEGRRSPPDPTAEEQNRLMADFFDRLLRPEISEATESNIRYFTMGESRWHESKVWPPPEFDSVSRFYFAAENSLSPVSPVAAAAADTYAVNFAASTGENNRWSVVMGRDVFSTDRTGQDGRLLVYTGPPLATDVEITGSPGVVLSVSSSAQDGAFFAYLEDVAPDGRATLLDEGELRFRRKDVNASKLGYPHLGPASSTYTNDAQPLIPGVPTELQFSMWPTSVLLRKGHRIRAALAGADAGSFRRYPLAGDVTWTIYRQAGQASYLELPLRPR